MSRTRAPWWMYVVAASFLGLFACNEPQKQDKSNQKSKAEVEIKNSDKWLIIENNDFSLAYPSNWQIDTSGRFGTSLVIFSDSTDNLSENVLLMLDRLNGKTFEEYIIVSEKEIEMSENKILDESINIDIINTD